MAFTGWLAGQRITAGRLDVISGLWTSYVPVWSSSSGAAPVLGNGTLDGEHSLTGGTCTVRISLIAGSTTTFGGGQFRFSLPFTAAPLSDANMSWNGAALGSDLGTAFYAGIARISSGGTVAMPISPTTASGSTPGEWNATRPFTWATGDYINLTVTYKPA